MMVIDCHTHIYPDEIARKIVPKMEEIYGVRRRHDATLDSLLKSLDSGNIDKAVVLPIANRPEHFTTNEWYAALAQHSSTIIPFGSIHPENDPKDLERLVGWELKGIKLQPNAQLFYPDETRMFPFYEKAEELGLIVVFHAGNEEGGVYGQYAQPESFVKVLQSFPGLKIVLSHLGGFQTWHKLDFVLGYENAYYDTAHVLGHIEDDLFLEIVKKIGIDKIIFGTDFPWDDHKETREHLEKLLGNDAVAVLSSNPQRLLALEHQ